MNKLGTKLGAIAMSAVMALTFAPSAAITSLAASGDGLLDATYGVEPVYRFYNPNTGEHLFTTSVAEADYLEDENWDNEGAKWYAPYISTKGIYRLYNPSTGEHLYTSDGVEIAHLVNNENWEKDFGGYPAFYAVDNAFDSDAITIGRFFNPAGTGVSAHIFSADPAEIGALKDKGYTEETGFRGYPLTYKPDEPVEELTVSIDNPTPKVGDTLTAIIKDADGNEVNPEDVDAKIQWYADGVAITGETDAEYDVLAGDAGVVLSVIVTIDDEEYTDSVKVANVAAEVTISDKFGLQTGGTGLVGDPIELSYGSEVGVPDSITWYRDSKILATYTDKAQSYSPLNGLAIGTSTTPGSGVSFPAIDFTNKIGKYWAVITTADGKTVKSNEIELSDVEDRAVIKSFSLEDNYETGVTAASGATKLDYSAKDGYVIATLVLNRDYAGNIRIYGETDKTFTTLIGGTDGIGTGVHSTRIAGGGAAAAGEFTVETSDKKMTNDDISTTATTFAKKYVADDGVTTYRWVIDDNHVDTNDGVTRGTSYVAVFDQTNIKGDEVTQGNENISPAAEAPYLTKPAKIVVTRRMAGQNPQVTLYGEDGKAFAWWGTGTALNANGIAALNVFEEIGAAKAKASTKAQAIAAATITKGEIAGNVGLTAAGTYTYYWASLKTVGGTFQKEAVELESEVVEGAAAVASKMTISQDSTTNSTANIALENVKADGTLYVIKGAINAADTDAQIVAKGGTHFVKVAKGDTKAVVTDIIDAAGAYYAVLIPEDKENFTRKVDGDGAGVVKNIVAALSSYEVKTKAVTEGTPTATALTAKDQFGNVFDTTGLNFGARVMSRATSATADTMGITAMTATIVAGTTVASGDVSVDLAQTGTAVKGDKWYTQIATGQYLVATCTKTGAATVAEWALSIAAAQP